ncbi:MAG: thioredoxin family protein [Sandaracinaceae bacterium]|nr:thioredoxin family protein [Sandaracinaceae bacterium]MDW8247004.1 cytochrome c biogenesis protein CcdA [Sandaracinaceae bacterium]
MEKVIFFLLFAVTGLSAKVSRADWLSEASNRFDAALSSGNTLIAIGLIYLVGLGTALTPCVYPMIAITVSVFGAREAKTKLEAALLSSLFVLGIATPFVPMGLAVAWTGGVFGSWLSLPWFDVLFALLFALLAASMIGFFELNLPPSLQNRLAELGGIGPKGAFALGFACAFVAAPCTGPALISLLSYIAKTGNLVLGSIGMLAYALGLGTLFWVVGTFAIALPKSGRWLEWIKSAFGIVLLVVALHFLKPLMHGTLSSLERNHWLLGIGALLFVLSIPMGAIHLDVKEGSPIERLRKVSGVLMAALGSFLLIIWLELPPPGAKLVWRSDFEQAMAEAHTKRLPIILDFGAEWCGACGELERKTFSHPRIVREARRFVAVRVDLTEKTPQEEALLARYDQRGLPFVVLHHSDGREAYRITRFIGPEEMLKILKEVH